MSRVRAHRESSLGLCSTASPLRSAPNRAALLLASCKKKKKMGECQGRAILGRFPHYHGCYDLKIDVLEPVAVLMPFWGQHSWSQPNSQATRLSTQRAPAPGKRGA